MTDARPAAKTRVRRVPSSSTTAAGASVLFLGALGVLGVQVARGHDPALGSGSGRTAGGAATPATPRRVVEKHIIRRVVVTKVVVDPVAPPAAAAPAAGAPVARTYAAPAPAPAAPRAAAPVVRTYAPPPPAAAAPAPAPAPVQTRAS